MAEVYLALECGRATRAEHIDGYWTDDGWQEAHTIEVPYGPGHRVPLGEVLPNSRGAYLMPDVAIPDHCPICGSTNRYVRLVFVLPDKPSPATSSEYR